MIDTQKFTAGEMVAWVDATNRLRYGIVAPDNGEPESDRVGILNSDGTYQAAPTRDRVAHLPKA